jgi:hypothetical protein
MSPARIARQVLLAEDVLVLSPVAGRIGDPGHLGYGRHRHVPAGSVREAITDASVRSTSRNGEFPSPDMTLAECRDMARRDRQHHAIGLHVRRFGSSIQHEKGGNAPAFALYTPEVENWPDDLAAFFCLDLRLNRKRHSWRPAVSSSSGLFPAKQIEHTFGHRFVQDAVIDAVKLLDVLSILLEESCGFDVGLDHQLDLPLFLVAKRAIKIGVDIAHRQSLH